MQSFVIGLSSQRMYRDLFWFLATVAPVLLLVILALLFVPRYRRAAAWALPVGAAGAILVAVVFHYNYALTTWSGHDSAIRWLDEAALRAGFAVSVGAYAVGRLACVTMTRLARRA